MRPIIRNGLLSFAVSLAFPLLAAARPSLLTIDPHLDLPADATSPDWNGKTDPSSRFDLDRARSGGLSAAGVALFVPQGVRDATGLAAAQAELVKRDAAIHAIVDKNPALAARALSPADLRHNAAAGRFSIIETILNTWPLGDDLDAFDFWYARGVRIVGFVHAGNNQYADSSRPALKRGDRVDENGGLTLLGRRAVARLNDLGVLIDVSQLSDKAFDQVLALSRAPVIASHSDLRSFVDNSRNLTDAQLDAIKRNNGVIAINAFPAYLHQAPATAGGDAPAHGAAHANLSELLDQLDYAVNRIGIDHVAISSDFNHGGGVEGWSDVGQTGNVTTGLRQRGYAPAQIAKLWGGNVLRVWQAAVDARSRTYKPHPKSLS